MALTTSDELQKQLTVIFGFNGQLNLEVGHIIGIGKLSEANMESLVHRMLHFLNSYNAMLRDYSGCELYSIEFALENLDKTSEQMKIMPKGMLFIPGEYKDCNTLLLLLSKELSLLDHTKSKEYIDYLGKLFFEVEEAAQNPKLNEDQRHLFLKTFAERFAYKLQSQVIEGKWNRKLVGLKSQDEREEELQNYLIVNMKHFMRWDRGKEINVLEPMPTVIPLKWSEKTLFDFYKHMILPSTAYVIAQNTFRLTANLMQIANTGTVDDLQDEILISVLNYLVTQSLLKTPIMKIDEFQDFFRICMESYTAQLRQFYEITTQFIKSGESGSIDQLFEKYDRMIPVEDAEKKSPIRNLAEIFMKKCRSIRFESPQKIRVIDFETLLIYMNSTVLQTIKSIKSGIPLFIQHYLLTRFGGNFIDLLVKEFTAQRKSVAALGLKYVEKFGDYLRNHIANLRVASEIGGNESEKSLNIPKIDGSLSSQAEIFGYFKTFVREIVDPFIQDVVIDISDIMAFVDSMLEDLPEVRPHIQTLACFPAEIEYLWGIMLRFTTINRFLRELPDEPIDPMTFSSLMLEFMKKRLGGVDLHWKDHVFKWISDFGQNYQLKYDAEKELKNVWTNRQIIDYFVEYIDRNVNEEISRENFKKPMKDYLSGLLMSIQNRNLAEIPKTFDMCQEILLQFPDYIKQTFLKINETFKDNVQPQSVKTFLGQIPSIQSYAEINIPENTAQKNSLNPEKTSPEILLAPTLRTGGIPAACEDFITRSQKIGEVAFQPLSFYDFILSREMKYFSKLIAKPTSIILRSTDKETFGKKEMFFHLDFKYWEKFLKLYVSTNYLKVRPQFQ
jgi:hypothetical protein